MGPGGGGAGAKGVAEHERADDDHGDASPMPRHAYQ